MHLSAKTQIKPSACSRLARPCRMLQGNCWPGAAPDTPRCVPVACVLFSTVLLLIDDPVIQHMFLYVLSLFMDSFVF